MKQRLIFLAIFLALFGVIAAIAPRPNLPERIDFDPITVTVASDLHYIAPELTDGGAYFTRIVAEGDGKAMAYCEEITDAFIQEIAALKPEVLLLAGDLTFNGARASHEALAQKLQAIESSGVRVLVIPGNHDLDNPMAASFRGDSYSLVESVDAESFAAIYAAYGYDEALSRDSASLSYTCELTPGLWALMLDVNTTEAPGVLTEDTFRWVQQQLDAAHRSGVRVLGVSHQNLLSHNSLFTYGYVIENRDRLCALYEQYGVLCNLSGHMHIQHTAVSDNDLPEILLSSLVTAPFQFGVLSLDASAISFRTQELVFPHRKEAQQFFWDSSFARASAYLPNNRQACTVFADINTAYFAGRGDRIPWDSATCEDIRRHDALLGSYLQSIYDDGFQDHTKSAWQIS